MPHAVKKRLLFVASTSELQAGGELSHLALIRDAQKRGYYVRVVVPGPGDFARTLARENIPHTIVHMLGWAPEHSFEAAHATNTKAVARICEIAKQDKIDCVITNTLNMPWAALAAAYVNLPHVWIIREMPLNEFSFIHNRYSFIKQFSNLLIANSGTVASHVQDRSAAVVKSIRSYIDVSGVTLSKRTTTKFVVIGGLQKQKNQLVVLEAAAKLKTANRLDSQIMCIGGNNDPAYYSLLEEFVRKHNLQNDVQFLGHRNSPFSLVGPNDIVIQPSNTESLGRVVVEAMKLGLICVGADIPGTKEAFALGGGTLYKKDSAEDLARVLENILNNFGASKRQAIASKKKALKNFSLAACHDPFFYELQKILGQPNPVASLEVLSPFLLPVYEQSVSGLQARQQNKELKKHARGLQQQKTDLQQQLNLVEQSRAWRIARFFDGIRRRPPSI